MEHVGDMAAKVAEELRAEQTKELDEGTRVLTPDDGHNVMMTTKRGLFSKVEFKWRDSDKLILEQIRASADQMFVHLFDDAIGLLDRLYESLRVASVNAHGVMRVDSKGRTIWETDNHGQPIERWDQLTGDDIERCLLDLTRIRFSVVPKVNDLLMEAMFAKRISTDSYDDAYIEMIDGTIGDKNAKANRKSRQDTYQAFFRYWLWTQGDVFLKELSNFQRVLERVRDWEVRGSWKRE